MEIMKGKRTKRPRPCLGGDAACFPTPSLESEFSDEISVSTEEEEDMANCLILLAQGCYNKQDGEEEDDEEEKVMSKKRLIEIDSIATGRTCYDIYECKTCNRRFPSFQALGGHRASHKKPRAEDKEVKTEKVQGQICHSPPPFPIHVAEVKPALSPLAIKASKVHECSVCGSEFSSGQALGGHMRRHRAAPQVKAAGESEEAISDHKTINILSFDLNLPAPVEDDQNEVVETVFRFRPKNHLVFAGPTLVGCHY